MTEIVNGHNKENKEIDQWIDRRSKFGNPFKISDFNDHLPNEVARELVVELYSKYFLKRVKHDKEFREEVEKLEDKTLACHCKPKKCHGDIIARYLND